MANPREPLKKRFVVYRGSHTVPRLREVFEDHSRKVEVEIEVARYEPNELLEIHPAARCSLLRTLTACRKGRIHLSAGMDARYGTRLTWLFASLVAKHGRR